MDRSMRAKPSLRHEEWARPVSSGNCRSCSLFLPMTADQACCLPSPQVATVIPHKVCRWSMVAPEIAVPALGTWHTFA